jgi:hypothetical protein
VFSAAMFGSNITLRTAASNVFSFSRPQPIFFRVMDAITAGYSLWIGVTMMAG